MIWHESDSNLEIEWNKSVIRKHELDLKSRDEYKFQKAITALKMIETPEIEEVDIKGKLQKVNVVNFYLPKNFAGDDMDSDYRDAQKIKLIENNVNRLNENND